MTVKIGRLNNSRKSGCLSLGEFVCCYYFVLYYFLDFADDIVMLSDSRATKWLCGRVPAGLQSGGCGFESRPGLLRTKVYSAFHPSGVGK